MEQVAIVDLAFHADQMFDEGHREQQLQLIKENGGQVARLKLLGQMASPFLLGKGLLDIRCDASRSSFRITLPSLLIHLKRVHAISSFISLQRR